MHRPNVVQRKGVSIPVGIPGAGGRGTDRLTVGKTTYIFGSRGHLLEGRSKDENVL